MQLTPSGFRLFDHFRHGSHGRSAGLFEGCSSPSTTSSSPADLIARGVEVSDTFHDVTGIFHHAGTGGRAGGPAPEHASYGSFASFSDPDGNGWLLQEIKTAPSRPLREG